MAQSIFIQITRRGSATGPFNIYWDNFNNVVALNIVASALEAGYTVSIPDAAQYVVLENMDPCGQNTEFRYIVPLSPTPTPSITPSISVTPSVTPSISVTPSVSVTPSISITPSITMSVTPSITPSVTPSISITPSISVTPSVSVTPASSITPSVSVTPSVSITPSITTSITPSITPSITASVTPSISITPTVTASVTPSVTASVTPSVSLTPGVSVTPSITMSITPSITPSISITASVTPSISITPTITPTKTASVTPSISITASVTPSISITPTVTASVTPSISITPTRTASVTPSISITPTITPTRTASVTPSISITPTITPTRTASITPSFTPSITPTLTPAVSYIYYSNTEYNTTELFLDNNVYVRKNPSTDLVNDVFSTPGDVLITGNIIYQGDSIYAQSQGFTGGYPAPAYGTSTRTLNVSDSAGNTLYNFTGDYTTYSNINTTFSIVGGRNYFVRGRTDFSWPTAATLSIQGMYIDYGVSQYYFQYFLDTAVDGDFTITANGGISADMYFSGDCTGGSEVNFGNSPSSTVIKGQYGYGYVTTGQSSTYGFSSYTLQNSLFVDGNFYQHGDTFVKGVTTVTVNIFTGCSPL